MVFLGRDYFKVKDLRRVERALTVQIELLDSLYRNDGIFSAVLLSVFSEGIEPQHRKDYLKSEIEDYQRVRNSVRDLIDSF